MSTKLKLVGVDVASFGDYFADRRLTASPSAPLAHDPSRPSKDETARTMAGQNGDIPTVTVARVANGAAHGNANRHANGNASGHAKEHVSEHANGHASEEANGSPKRADAASPKKRHGHAAAAEGPVETLTYRDPFGGVYKKSASYPPASASKITNSSLQVYLQRRWQVHPRRHDGRRHGRLREAARAREEEGGRSSTLLPPSVD